MIEIKRNMNSPRLLYEAKENGGITAALCGEISEKTFHIQSFEGDKYLFDGVLRAALNNAEHEGAISAVIEETVSELFLTLFGYKRDIPSIFEFFEEKNTACSCNCKKNGL